MTKESLQAKCNDSGLNLKILFVEKTDFGVYWVVYTFDLDYQGRDSYEKYIIEPEMDELVVDEDEFVFFANFRAGNVKVEF